MSATTGRSVARTHRRGCSTPRAIERESIPSGIWPVTPAFYRPMRSTVTTDSIFPTANPVDRRGAVLEQCAPEVFRTCRHRRQCAAEQDSDADLADRIRGRQTHRCALRHRAEINGLSAAGRLAVRQERSAPLVAALEGWM